MSQRNDTTPHTTPKPLLADVIVRNIANPIAAAPATAQRRTFQEQLADVITSASGRMGFVYLHMLWFGGWIVINAGWRQLPAFDPFPYGLLTMIVSLEAILLATFVLLSQNRLSEETERRADLALHIGLLTEHEVTRVLQMLEAIHETLGIVNHSNSELAQLEIETKPEDVLAEIQRLHDHKLHHQAAAKRGASRS